LVKAGVAPAMILAALTDAPPRCALDRAYNPDQPRVPAGNGIFSGRWTAGEVVSPPQSGFLCSTRNVLTISG